jgi:hypothetical protein
MKPARFESASGARRGLSQKLQPVVIGRRNDEAIQVFSDISGLLPASFPAVRNDESGLLRQPLPDSEIPSSGSSISQKFSVASRPAGNGMSHRGAFKTGSGKCLILKNLF